MKENKMPFLLAPTGKDYLWGGTRLKKKFNKDLPLDPLSETWECSTHKDGPSFVNSGPYKGLTLKEVLRIHPEYLGKKHENPEGELPILIKFIDARKDLSVQVHPSDEYAREKENGQLGKTEMWFVLESSKDASLMYGFREKMNKRKILQSLKDNSLEQYLNKVKIHKNDFFLIPSGTVHAIGKGSMVAEIQENSNLTYRLYDYGRIGKDGKPRELHVQKALDVMNLNKTVIEKKQPLKEVRGSGYTEKTLVSCPYFTTEEFLIDTSLNKNLMSLSTSQESFEVLLCYEGCGMLFEAKNHTSLPFFKGDCIFLPAGLSSLKLFGIANLLRIHC